MKYKDADKILKQALFLRDAPTFDRRFATNEGALRDLFVEAIRLACPGVDVMPNMADIGLISVSANGNKGEVSIQNLLQQLKSKDLQGARQTAIEHLISIAPAIAETMKPKSAPSFNGELLAIIGPDRMVADINEKFGRSRLVSWKLGENANAIAILDNGKTQQYVMEEHLPEIGLTEAQAKGRVLYNLNRKLKTKKPEIKTSANGTVTVYASKSMAASMLAVEPFMTALRQQVNDDLVIHLIDQDAMVVMPAGNAESLYDTMGMVASGKIPSTYHGAHFLFDDTGLSSITLNQINDLIAAAVANPIQTSKPTLN